MKTLCFDCIDSTNTYCKCNYHQLDDCTFVQALMQQKGKGRNERQWVSEKGSNLLFSLLIKDETLFEKTAAVSIVTAYSILSVLERYGLKPLIKWPNDVYVNDKKICGILLESICSDRMECLIIGVGLNVNQQHFPNDCLHQPTSVSCELKRVINLNEIRDAVYAQLLAHLQQLSQGMDFYEEIKALDCLKDREVFALINNEKKKIKVLGIAQDYSLAVWDGETVQNLNSGEISFHL